MVLARYLGLRNAVACRDSLKAWWTLSAKPSRGNTVRRIPWSTVQLEKISRRLGSVLQDAARFISSALLHFSDDPEVPDLTENNFHDYIRHHGKAFIMWYDPHCPVCRQATVTFERLYSEMRGSLAFGAVNAPANEDLAISQRISVFPTFRLYSCRGDQCGYKNHEGPLSLEEMKSFVRYSTTKSDHIVAPEQNDGQHKSIGNSIAFEESFVTMSSNEKHKEHNCIRMVWETSPFKLFKRNLATSQVICSIPDIPTVIKVGKTDLTLSPNVMELRGSNFNEKIKSFDSVLVYFYTSWCMHCDQSLRNFIKAADQIEDTVGVLAICNAEESLEIVDRYYVGKIPTLKYFRKGRYITDYIGGIQVDALVKFMKEPHVDEDFLAMVTRHKPLGDLHEVEVLTPTQKKKLWHGTELITEVTSENVNKVLGENQSLLILFYACWSKICVGIKHDYLQVAKTVEKTDVVLAACDCEEHFDVADRFMISKIPTIKYFRNGTMVRDFNGDYHAESILKFLKDPTKLQVSPKDQRFVDKPKDYLGIPDYWKGVEGGDKLVHLNDFNYKTIIEKSPAMMVMFYVSWCKSCTPMKRELGRAAIHMDKNVGIFAACDAESNNEMADAFSVIKLPTMKYFKNGAFVVDYTGRRTAEDLMAFMENPRVHRELTPLSEFKKDSENKKK